MTYLALRNLFQQKFRLALPLATPNAALVLTGQAMIRVGLAALLIGVIAALAPAWQMARLDPAQVFRG